jgi:glutamate/tyrosine decarboxylase-like PLP-dependent enzyme
MSARELGRMMECDASSGNPVSCIVATVGSEVASVDPIRELAAIARARAAWFHVDATRGGSMAIVPERRRILDGVELANSVAVSLRDWFYLPFNWNVVYTAKPGRLRPPLPQGSGNRGEPVSPRHYFQSLKPWILMRHLGRQGMIGLLRSELALARRFGLELAADPRFEIVAPVELPVVCFRYLGTSEQNRQIAERVNAAGCSLLSMTSIQGNSVLRISVRQLGPDWNTASRVCEIVKTACDDLGLAREGVASARQLR